MRESTRQKKRNAKEIVRIFGGEEDFSSQVIDIANIGKQVFDGLSQELGRRLVETILLMDRERLTGPDYHPNKEGIYKWASQGGSVFIGDQKMKVSRPRLRGPQGEIGLPSYERLSSPEAFSKELLIKLLNGLAGKRYEETVIGAAQAFGVSPSSVSRRFIEASGKALKEFLERELNKIHPFAIFMDTVHRGGKAFIVALCIDSKGNKHNLGFWEGATENSEICSELLKDLERRGMKLSSEIIWITDGGTGVIKTLKDRYGKKLIHQRCTIHKLRNIRRHLAKKYRETAKRMFKNALGHVSHEDAQKGMEELYAWLLTINESAARSLKEGLEELLTLKKLGITGDLYRVLHTTNGIENLFSSLRHREHNIKNYSPTYKGNPRSSKVSQRWLAAVLLNAEKRFRRIKGYEQIPIVMKRIKKKQEEKLDTKVKKVA